MKCPFCAEQIQDEAILCRFCGATKRGQDWVPLETTKAKPKRAGEFTIRTAGVLFILSAVFEAFSLTSEIPLFGALRGGAVAVIYHLVFVAVFIALGIGLFKGKRWGCAAVKWGTAVYTLDRALYLWDGKARDAYVQSQVSSYQEITNLVDMNSISQIMALIAMVSMVCWWGFALYIHLRRDYFLTPQSGEPDVGSRE